MYSEDSKDGKYVLLKSNAIIDNNDIKLSRK